MPSSTVGGTWLSGDTIGKSQTNLKTNLVVPSATYVPVISTDVAAGQMWIDPTTGLIRIGNSGATAFEMVSTSYLDNAPNGFPVNTSGNPNPNTQSTIAFTNSSPARTFSITPTGSSFSVYVHGTEYTFTTAQTVQITNTEGLWYIYFNSSGVLTASQSIWSLENDAVVAYIYWDATDAICIYFADERHMFSMDWRTHYYLHQSIGCRYISGLAISGYTVGSAGDANVWINLANGTVFDEDLEFDIAYLAYASWSYNYTNITNSEFYEQPIQKSGSSYGATIPVYYQLGSTGIWRKQVTQNQYVYLDTPNTTVYYNSVSGSTWSLTDVPSGADYFSMWIFACNDVMNPIIAIMGQQVSSSLTNLEANDTFAALSISSGLPFLEMKLLYRIALHHLNSYSGSTYCRIEQVDDFRTSSIGGSGQNATGYISSVGLGFSVSAGNLALASALWSIDASGNLTLNGNCIVDNGGTPFTLTSSHLQNVGTGDSPTFGGVALGSGNLTTTGTVACGQLLGPSAGSPRLKIINTGSATDIESSDEFYFTSYNGAATLMTLDTSGNLTTWGNITASSAASSTANIAVISTAANQAVELIIQRNASSGSYNVGWVNYINVSSTSLLWYNNVIGGIAMTLDTSGNLSIAGTYIAFPTGSGSTLNYIEFGLGNSVPTYNTVVAGTKLNLYEGANLYQLGVDNLGNIWITGYGALNYYSTNGGASIVNVASISAIGTITAANGLHTTQTTIEGTGTLTLGSAYQNTSTWDDVVFIYGTVNSNGGGIIVALSPDGVTYTTIAESNAATSGFTVSVVAIRPVNWYLKVTASGGNTNNPSYTVIKL
jgi:hypothetical protein